MPINPYLNDPRLKEIKEKKARGGFGLKKAAENTDPNAPLTVADLVRAVFHDNPEAILRSIGSKARAKRVKKEKEDHALGKRTERVFKRTAAGKVDMQTHRYVKGKKVS